MSEPTGEEALRELLELERRREARAQLAAEQRSRMWKWFAVVAAIAVVIGVAAGVRHSQQQEKADDDRRVCELARVMAGYSTAEAERSCA